MGSVIRVIQVATMAGLCLLAVTLLARWWRERDRALAYVALAISLLAAVSVLGEIRDLTERRYPVLFYASVVAFLASGYCFLMFRHQFVALSRAWRALAIAALVASGIAAIVAGLPYEDDAAYTGVQGTVVLAIVLVWSLCVGEPIVRFWLAGKGQPAVQRARLRSLSLGYAAIVAILLISVVVQPEEGSAPQLIVQFTTVLLVPLLFVSFSPPRWLRTIWREREEEDLLLAQELLMFAQDRRALAERALHWATRLVGANAGFFTDDNDEVLSAQGLTHDEVTAILSQRREDRSTGTFAVQRDQPRYAITVPVRSERGTATLGVVSGAFTPLFGSDEVARLAHHAAAIGVALDRAHLTEELRRVDEARRDFIANAAHELRSPLTTIVGISSTLSGRRADLSVDKWAAGLDALNRQGQRMRTLINNLLDLTQMEQGRLKVNQQPVELFSAAEATIATSPPPEGTTVEIGIPSGLTVLADPMRLDQILTNLLTNAYRYGGKRIRIDAAERPDGVVLSITDDGPGVPEELAPHVFDAFARGSNGKKEGSGLGLAIVRRLAEAFGGEVTYEAAEPQGARFLVHLRRVS